MGVKWTCTFFCLLGVAYLSVGVTSATDNVVKGRNRRDAGVNSPMERTKRQAERVVHDDEQGGHFESIKTVSNDGKIISTSTSYSNPSGGSGSSSVSTSSSSSSSSSSGSSGSSAGVGVGSRSGFDAPGPGAGFPPFAGPTQAWSSAGQQGGFGGFGTFPNFVPHNVGFRPYNSNHNSNFYQPPRFNSQQSFPQQPFGPNNIPYQPFYGQNNRLGYGPPFNNFYPNQFDYGTRGGFGNQFGNFGGFNHGFPYSSDGGFPQQAQTGGHFAEASASLGSQGGFLKGQISPGVDGVESRFSENIGPSSGNNFATFSHSTTSVERDADGNEVVRELATSGTNDNGKVTIKTVHYP